MGKTLIYHGSYAEIRMPKILVGRNTKDFGFGFYCTANALKCLRFEYAEEVKP